MISVHAFAVLILERDHSLSVSHADCPIPAQMLHIPHRVKGLTAKSEVMYYYLVLPGWREAAQIFFSRQQFLGSPGLRGKLRWLVQRLN